MMLDSVLLKVGVVPRAGKSIIGFPQIPSRAVPGYYILATIIHVTRSAPY